MLVYYLMLFSFEIKRQVILITVTDALPTAVLPGVFILTQSWRTSDLSRCSADWGKWCTFLHSTHPMSPQHQVSAVACWVWASPSCPVRALLGSSELCLNGLGLLHDQLTCCSRWQWSFCWRLLHPHLYWYRRSLHIPLLTCNFCPSSTISEHRFKWGTLLPP